jgi:hypothetical protein
VYVLYAHILASTYAAGGGSIYSRPVQVHRRYNCSLPPQLPTLRRATTSRLHVARSFPRPQSRATSITS